MKTTLAFLFMLLSCTLCAQLTAVQQLYKQGIAHYRNGEHLKAIEIFEKIYATDSAETDALNFTAILYNQTGQYAKAAAACAKLCKLFPENDEFFSSASFNYTLINEPKKAAFYGKLAVDLNGYKYNNMLNLAHAYLLQYKKDEAIYWYVRAMQWTTSQTAFERSFLGDLKMIDSLKLMPSNTVQQFADGLKAEFAALDMQDAGTIYLDSILSYINKKPTNEEKLKLTQWKKDFIEAEVKTNVKRSNVAASFAIDIGLTEYRNRNRATAMGYYFTQADRIYEYTGDSLSRATLQFFLSKELLIYQKGENKYGKNADAVSYALQGKKLVEQYKLDELNAIMYHQLAAVYFQQEENAQALYNLHKLFSWSYKRNNGKGFFWATNELSIYYAERNNLDSALYYHRACLQNIEQAGLSRGQIDQIKLNGLDILYNNGKYQEALLGAVLLKEEISKNKNTTYSGLCELEGECWFALNLADSAYVYYKEAVESHIRYSKKMEEQKTGALPVQVSEARITSLRMLCQIAAKRKDNKALFYWSEMTKDNLLRYLISFQYEPEYVTPLEKAKASLPSNAAAIMYIATGLLQAPCMAFNNSAEKLGTIESTDILKQVQQAGLTKTFATLLQLTNKKNATTIDSVGSARSLALMQYYYLSNVNPTETRSYIASKKSNATSNAATNEEKIKLSKLLYTILIKPFEPIIIGKKTLYISADLTQHFIPFETLIMNDGRYLAEAYDIIYTPSFTIHELLEGRSYNSGNTIIAAGNPDYSSYHPETLQGRAYDFSLLGITSWTDLPGTQQELNMLQQQFDSVTVHTNKQLSETAIKNWSKNGDLSKAAVLHFSLHGISGKTSATEDNSIVVTEPDNGKEDGLLQFYEAFELEIHPQMVCLSACETGIGMIDQDGSLATMGTAFLAAGAKSVLATNWSIDDAATALFMKDVYQQVRATGIGYAAAIANTKRKFIKGDFGEQYKQPYYWAPFKYYGN